MKIGTKLKRLYTKYKYLKVCIVKFRSHSFKMKKIGTFLYIHLVYEKVSLVKNNILSDSFDHN